MFFGEYEHTIDDKSRITLPARFRDAVADGVVLSKGLDGSVDVYPRSTWEMTVVDRIGRLDPLLPDTRLLQRHFFGGASEDVPDKQGRVLAARGAHPPREPCQGSHGRREQRPPRDLGSRRLGGAPGGDRRERRQCCPTSCRAAAADHTPVLADEVRELLAVQPGETVVDATFGAGGHARLLAEDLQGSGKLVAIDRDPSVKPQFDRFKAQAGVDVRFLRGDFAIVLSQLAANEIKADAILLDIGVSSMQLDRPERGFSYATDAPLDMRMDPSGEITAATIVNTWDERELATIFKRYGEERFAGPIARAIVRRRAEQAFFRTGDLVDVIKMAIPTPARFGEGHPAKRVFQALRIAVNDELGQLEAALPAALEMLRPGGRLAVISFHSLEDRIVKQFLAARAKGCTCPPEFPICVCGKEPEVRLLTRKPVRPSARELDHNPRAASSRLRAAVKV